jgi:hypothetical protein
MVQGQPGQKLVRSCLKTSPGLAEWLECLLGMRPLESLNAAEWEAQLPQVSHWGQTLLKWLLI